MVGHQFIEHAEARSIDVLVGQEIILVPFECGVGHLDRVQGCERPIDQAWARISWHNRRLRFLECIHRGGHGKARPTVYETLGSLDLLECLHYVLVQCVELGKVQAGRHCGRIAEESRHLVKGDNIIHVYG